MDAAARDEDAADVHPILVEWHRRLKVAEVIAFGSYLTEEEAEMKEIAAGVRERGYKPVTKVDVSPERRHPDYFFVLIPEFKRELGVRHLHDQTCECDSCRRLEEYKNLVVQQPCYECGSTEGRNITSEDNPDRWTRTTTRTCLSCGDTSQSTDLIWYYG